MNDVQLLAEISGTQFEPMLTWAHLNEDDPNAESPFDAEAAHEGTVFFLHHKLVGEDFPATGPFGLTGRGHRLAEQLIESRRSGPLRVEAVERSLLKFIEEHEPSGTQDFIGKTIEDVVVTEKEHDVAVVALLDSQCIKGEHSPGYVALFRPEITPQGRRALRSPGVPSDILNNGGPIINNDNRFQNMVTGDVGQVAAGVNVTQSGNYVTFDKRTGEAREKVVQLRELLSEIEDVPESISSALQQLEAVGASPEAGQPAWRLAVGTFSMALLAKAGEESYLKVMEVAHALGQLIGAS